MKAYQLGPIVTMEAGETLTKHRFVDYAGKHTVDLPAIGVTLFDVTSGDQAQIQVSGIAVVTSAGSVSAGDRVKSDADGKATTDAASDAAGINKVCGIALDDGTTDGDLIRVALNIK